MAKLEGKKLTDLFEALDRLTTVDELNDACEHTTIYRNRAKIKNKFKVGDPIYFTFDGRKVGIITKIGLSRHEIKVIEPGKVEYYAAPHTQIYPATKEDLIVLSINKMAESGG